MAAVQCCLIALAALIILHHSDAKHSDLDYKAIRNIIRAELSDGPEVNVETHRPSNRADRDSCHRYGVYEVMLTLPAVDSPEYPYFNTTLAVDFSLPDGAGVEVSAFYDGVEPATGAQVYVARCYCGQPGAYRWASRSNMKALDQRSGTFTATADHPAGWHGKLRIHAEDTSQFQWDDGTWYLHLGDTGYQYISPLDMNWKRFIDQSVKVRQCTNNRPRARGTWSHFISFTATNIQVAPPTNLVQL